MFKLFNWLFSKKVRSNASFEDLLVGEEFRRTDSQQSYVKISPIAYCESEPVNNHTSLKWRIVNENFPVEVMLAKA